jgi:hypothetical protein
MSKIVKLIITGLTIILIILSSFTYGIYHNKTSHKVQANINNQVRQEQTFRIIDKETVIKALKKENSINILSGETNTRCKFSNKNISSDDVAMKWLRDKIDNWNSKDITIDSEFSFMFSYDLSDPIVNIKDNTVYINISYNKLSLTKCELSNIQTQERVGWLQNNFSPSEINALNARIKSYASNSILSNEKFRKECIDNLKENITEIVHTLSTKDTNVEFTISNYDVIQQTDVQVIS